MLLSAHVDGLLLKTSYMGCWHPAVGPVTLDASIGVLRVHGAEGIQTSPLVNIFVESKLIQLCIGQELIMTIDLIAKHIQEFLQV